MGNSSTMYDENSRRNPFGKLEKKIHNIFFMKKRKLKFSTSWVQYWFSLLHRLLL